MRYTMTSLLMLALVVSVTAISTAAEARMTPELLWELGRVSGGAVSGNGLQIAYTVRSYELKENTGSSELHLLTLDGRRDRVIGKAWKSVSDLQWGQGTSAGRLFFVGIPTDVEDAKPQVWSVNPKKVKPRQVTDIEAGVANLKVAPTGTHLAFTVDVKMDATVNELYSDLPKADARIIDSLLFRHWNAWHDYAYSHLHAARFSNGRAVDVVDLMDGLRVDCPLQPFGGAESYAWSSDGREIAYSAKIVNNPAESTDSDIYLVGIDGGHAKCITPGRPGYETEPVYSPDGKTIAFHSMERGGFESDRNRILLYDRSRGSIDELTVGLDQTAHSATWMPDSKSMLFVSEWRGTNQIFRIWLNDHKTTQVTHGRYNWSLSDLFADGRTALVARQDMLRPNELATLALADGTHTVVTTANDAHYMKLALPRVEQRQVTASDGKTIHNWVIYPPDFDPTKKWPLITYCQGGPQGQIGQWFSYRWNFHLMAAQGYVVVAVNRRGLPGFGRPWNDQISGDWGGQAMQDILASTDDLLSESYIDRSRTAAVGASFGGYTVYWLMGNHANRFRCMIAHCGVFNLESWYSSTEELFFANWDLGGPYWKSQKARDMYDRFSPHRFIGDWKTPLLVIHGEKDFRVPVTQGIEAFTAAQIQGVPSRFLYYPAEGHWVLSPQNGVLWHRVFFDWLASHCQSPK
ncbi:MAG: S9 family peptidase [Pirellulaceae bacterium]|nr:S9 family peptidase [Pirellulaceae bacterium]